MYEKSKFSEYELLTIIESNNEDEREAITGYYKLLDVIYKTQFSSEENKKIVFGYIPQIEEFISDEMQHSDSLSKFSSLLSGIQPSKD